MTMLAGAVIVCLLVGGFVGYWYASQSQQAYVAKGAALGCFVQCEGQADQKQCTQSCYDSIIGSEDYLQKKAPWNCCAAMGGMCCGSWGSWG
ncbi:hypothetical protein COU36_04895 [Candidatus Micrarchaeota archaeon CG10_big_fil_rev_8_21_14_0_10_59_7]|nr:MAG: hypothetical protein COU36_04895 [Candidatus Micrarchaeota archaeon CG10_big_fil_rev_8_21_14_0_10_59_7]